MTTATKERGVIRREGMGGFLNPPTHPEHTNSVEFDLHRSRENRGGMSLSTAVECEWLDDATRAEAKRRLDEWAGSPIESPDVQAWIRQVLGYFKGCYRGEGAEPECWHAGNLRIIKSSEPQPPVEEHAGVHLIRKYYPEFAPTPQHFAEAKWGS